MPRKSLKKKEGPAGYPLREKRTNLIEKIRLDVSGHSQKDVVQQLGTQLKKTTKTHRQSVLNAAGSTQPFISRKQGLAKRVVHGQSWNKHKKERPIYSSFGVEFESERPKEIDLSLIHI